MASELLIFMPPMKMIHSLFCRLLVPAVVAGLMIVPTASLRANIIAVPDVDGLQAFEDTNTGLTWLGLANFYDESPDQMMVTAEAAGFTVANLAQVQTLLNSLPLTSGQWPSYAAIMGSAPNRGLIWGDFADPSNPTHQEWAYAYSPDQVWSYQADALGSYSGYTNDEIPNAGTDFTDLDLWAVETGGQTGVPDAFPTVLMLGASVLMMAGLRRRLGAASSA